MKKDKELSEQLHNLASNAFNVASIVELTLSKIEDSSCKCMNQDVFNSLMAVKDYMSNSVADPLAVLAESVPNGINLN